MSKVTVDQIEDYVQKMLSMLTGDRGQMAADLSRLLAVIRGDIPLCPPGVQPMEPPAPSAPRMTPTAATPKPKPAPAPEQAPEPVYTEMADPSEAEPASKKVIRRAKSRRK